MSASYIPFLVAVLIAVVIAAAMVLGSYLLGPRKPFHVKETTYECGMTPVGSARERFPVAFYMVAIAFIVFDVEMVFLYPWAVAFSHGDRLQRLFFLADMAVFVLILIVAYVYLLGARVLEWTPEGEVAGDDPATVRERAVRRPPIRFGNEASGPVRLSKEDLPESPRGT